MNKQELFDLIKEKKRVSNYEISNRNACLMLDHFRLAKLLEEEHKVRIEFRNGRNYFIVTEKVTN